MKKTIIFVGAIFTLILYLAYSESNEIVVNKNAGINGVISQLKRYAQKDEFWKRQLFLVTYEISNEESFPVRMAELKGNVDKILIEAKDSLQKFNDENPSLKLEQSEAQKQADALRLEADYIERKEMDAIMQKMRLERINNLKAIQVVIKSQITKNST